MQPMRRLPTSSIDTGGDFASEGSVGRGFLSGLVPLAPLVVIVGVALALATLARMLTAGQGFAVQQWAAGIILVLGLLGAAASYVVFCWRVLRQVRRWQEMGQIGQAKGALWGLVVVALIVLLPLLLALVIPQHPAPNLAP